MRKKLWQKCHSFFLFCSLNKSLHKMIKLIFTVCSLGLTLLQCQTVNPTTSTTVNTSTTKTETTMNDTVELKGRIEKIQFVNKAGRPIDGVFDLFFVSGNGKRIFIKTRFGVSAVSREELVALEGKSIIIEGIIEDGLWDADSNEVQSRVGKYLRVLAVRE